MKIRFCKNCGNQLKNKNNYKHNACSCNNLTEEDLEEKRQRKNITQKYYANTVNEFGITNRRAVELKLYYGLESKNYKEILDYQNNCCAICKSIFSNTPHVDHDHETGKVRGLLCSSCNSALGSFKDSFENLSYAIDYLFKYKTTGHKSLIYSEMSVEYLGGLGDDLEVVNTARVSFNKESNYAEDIELELENSKNHKLYSKYKEYLNNNTKQNISSLTFSDYKLIFYLAREGHWSPFSHNSIKFRIKVPIFVARQLVKSQVGLTVNEVSRRYFDGPVELFKMDFKEASSNKRIEGENFKKRNPIIDEIEALTVGTYYELLKDKTSAEDSRSILPLNMMTTFIWSGSLAAFIRVVQLRIDVNTQRQTREVAQKIFNIIKEKFPVSCSAYFDND